MNSHYKLLVDKAYSLHASGDYEQAEMIYSKLLESRPEDINVLNLFGILSISMKNYERAITLLTKAFLYNKSTYVASNLAKAYYLNNEIDNAIKIYKQALENEENDDIYYSLAIACKKINDFDSAVEYYLKAIKLNPQNYSAMYNLSLLYSDTGHNDKAIYFALKAVEINDTDVDILTLLSGYFEEEQDYQSSIKYLEKAVFLAPDKSIFYYNLGVLYSKLDNFDKAVENYKKALLLNPMQIEAHVNIASLYKLKQPEKSLEHLKIAHRLDISNETISLALGQIYKDLSKNDESCKILNEILANNPKCAEAYSLLAVNAMDMAQYQKALEYSDEALKIEPDNLNYQHGRAIALKYLSYFDEAKSILKKVVSDPKADNQSKIALGMMYLQEKNFNEGMELYLNRNKDTRFVEIFKDKIWSKPFDIENKTVLLYSNCGLGDTIMYSRFFPLIESKAKKVIVQTDRELIDILSYNFKNIQFITKKEKMTDYDVAVPVMDLQYALNIDFSSLKETSCYLSVDKALIGRFSRLEMFNTKEIKAGLFWHGNKKILKNRAIPFEMIKKLVKACPCRFYSFQLNAEDEESSNIINLKDYINNYNDTAALLKNIDLLITADSSIVHMAGALGVKTFLLLPSAAEWRWFFDTEKTIWYKNVKIFKQKNSSSWDDVTERVILELNQNAY